MAKLTLGRGTNILEFPSGWDARYANHLKFIAQLKSKGVYPELRVFGVRSPREHVIVVSGSVSESRKLSRVFYTPAAEEIVAREFRSDWDAINPQSSVANVADAGSGVDLRAFEERLSALSSPDYVLDCEIGTNDARLEAPAQKTPALRPTTSAPTIPTTPCPACSGPMKSAEWWCRNCGDIQWAVIAAPGVFGLLLMIAAGWAWSLIEGESWRYALTLVLGLAGGLLMVIGVLAFRDALFGGNRVAVSRAHLATAADRARREGKRDDTPRPSDRFGAAWQLAQRGKLHEAVDAFGTVPQGDPSYSKAVFNRGLLLAQLGYPRDALAVLTTLREPDPDTVAAIDALHRAEAAGEKAPTCTGVPLRA